MQLKASAYIEETEYHHLDHLGVFAAFNSIPLFTSDPNLFKIAKTFYKDLEIYLKTPEDLQPKFFSENFDVIVHTNFWNTYDFEKTFQGIIKKPMRVYLPHGNSDKGQNYFWMENFAHQEVVLYYGQRMLDFLQEKNVFLKKKIAIGNFRLQYWLKHKEFFASKVSHLKKPNTKTFLFAPTWNKNESCLFHSIEPVLKALKDYHILLKVHPAFERDHLIEMYKLHVLLEKYDHITLLTDFPIIYPLLDIVDFYLGDASSIAYDMLFFDKPLFFFKGKLPWEKTFIHHLGGIIDPEIPLEPQLNKYLKEDAFFSVHRKEAYKKTFISDMDSHSIMRAIYFHAKTR
jgi:hypothetical protein